ncbi:UNVERIFIED_CONTAM: Leucine-rich repeat receptor-like protein kinase PXC1 [Sesamum latifolium]|uniref:Leucine-rich repeat receptor-like protein kinase PXC1 n=1 Tax=Sesamum latifolium TaxID=2727402 RepID=A0AAW2UK25_9LAMI
MRILAATISVFLVSFFIHSIAFEVNEFFPGERDALMQLRDVVNSTYNLHANWTGPPCNDMNQSRWAGIGCSDWHVTHLVLEGIELTDLPRLTKLELQENDLSGQIPPFDQQSLIAFNVSNNKLEGPIPSTPVLQRFPKSSYDNNSDLCGEIPGLSPCSISVPPPVPGIAPAPSAFPSRKEDHGVLKSWSIALIAAGAAAVLVFVILMLLCYCTRVCGEKTKKQQEQTVAVKRLEEVNTLSKKEFVQQMRLLGNIKHENLAKIISFYHSREEKLIISEYVPDGSLFSLLHENRGMRLEWKTRVSIIKDVAEGVELLHQCLGSHQRVPHGNLKSSNVLIQRANHNHVHVHVRVKLTDYGLLPLVPVHKLYVRKTPEFVEGKKMTRKADVYCFGILVLEILTGKVPRSSGRGRGEHRDLSGWVRAAVDNEWSTDILDVEILGEKEGYDEMLKLTEIGLECTDVLPERRPTITQVLSRIQDINS